MGFGDFMSGMQGGMSAMDDLKNSRLRRKLYDQALTEGDYMLAGKERARERAKLPGIARSRTSDTFIGKLGDKLDPVISRFMESIGRGSGAIESPTAMTLPTAEEVNPEEVPMSEEDFGAAYEEGIALADGGLPNEWDFVDDAKNADPKKARPKLTEEEFARRRAAAKADLTGKADQIKPVEYASKANKATIDKVGADVTPKSAIPETPPKGRFARGVARAGGFLKGAGAGMLAAGAAGAALENSLAPDEKIAEYYRRIGRPGGEKDAGPLETTGVRAMGVLQDVGRTFLPKVVEDKLFPYLGESEQAAPSQAAPSQAAPKEAIPTSSGPSNPRRYRGQGAARRAAPAAAPESAIPAEPAEVNPLDGFDVTKVNAADIPNFSNQDWVSFREEAIKDYVSSGLSYAEAWDKVDQQVVATQQRGFMHFGNQARALLANGDLKGAATAVRAAFQYFPSTTDLQVGEYNGHLVAFGVDEDTGEQVGSPMVITPDFLDSALMNFSDRKAWTEFAQDNRRMDQADTELEQGSRRLDLMEEGLGIERENALTRRLDAIGSGLAGGGGGLKETDIATARKQLNDWAYAIGGGKGADPALPAALSALAEAEYKRRGGDLSTIVMRLEEMMRSPGGPDTILAAARRLASGQ